VTAHVAGIQLLLMRRPSLVDRELWLPLRFA
jgi:hypothetical protein